MYPHIEINLGAISLAVIANIGLGFLWYGPLFGRSWMKEIGLTDDMRPDRKAMIQSMILMVAGAFLTAYVLAHSSAIWRPSVWGLGEDSSSLSYGFYAALFTWFGFYLPQHFNLVGFEMKSWKLFAINGGFTFVNLQIVALVVSLWR